MQKQVLIFLLFMSVGTQAFAEKMTIAFSGAEIRTAPSAMSAKVIVRPPANTPVEVLEKGKEYYKIKTYKNQIGYVHKSLLVYRPAIVVLNDRANVRSGSGTQNDVVFQLSHGETARVLSSNGGWVEIESASGKKGWIADFLVWGE